MHALSLTLQIVSLMFSFYREKMEINFAYSVLFTKKSHHEHISQKETFHINAINGIGNAGPFL